MPVQNKRAGSLKVLTCRVCNKEFTRRKFQPVCCHACNLIYKSTCTGQSNTLSQADLQGASNDQHRNIPQQT